MKISLIIPAYNEGKRIGSTLRDYYNAFTDEFDDFEMIVEMDGCMDDTAEIVADFSVNKDNITIVEYPERIGKGGGLKRAFRAASGDIIGFTDADNSTKVTEFIELIHALEGTDIVVGQRYGGFDDIPLVRRVFSRGFNILVRLLFRLGISDTQCGAKVFRKEVVRDVLSHLIIDDFAFDVNFLYSAKKLGFKIKEVEIEWEYSEGSKIKLFNVTKKMFISLLKLRLFYSPFRFLIWTNQKEEAEAL
ncbi:MAG: glycosyltransferase family 2 protein [Proteobacteria bacterium]|nr:glycosyltransferase family 2 protein [Pseudomonadota bacterium]